MEFLLQYLSMNLLEVIKNIIKEKEVACVRPTHVLIVKDLKWRLQNRATIEYELKVLEEKGLIQIGNTINDQYIIIV